MRISTREADALLERTINEYQRRLKVMYQAQKDITTIEYCIDGTWFPCPDSNSYLEWQWGLYDYRIKEATPLDKLEGDIKGIGLCSQSENRVLTLIREYVK